MSSKVIDGFPSDKPEVLRTLRAFDSEVVKPFVRT